MIEQSFSTFLTLFPLPLSSFSDALSLNCDVGCSRSPQRTVSLYAFGLGFLAHVLTLQTILRNYGKGNMEPTIINRSLELRINSVQDAKSAVFNGKRINETIESLGLDSVQLLIAQEIKSEVQPILTGVFRVRTYIGYTKPLDQNVLYSLPHYPEKPPAPSVPPPRRVIKVYPQKPATVEQKRRGPKKGWKNRIKEPSPNETLDPVKT